MRFLLVTFFISGLIANLSTGSCHAEDSQVTLNVVDADTGKPLECRIYFTAENGDPYFFSSVNEDGSAYRYEKQNWLNEKSVEYHTTVSADPCVTSVPSGQYRLVVERGKSYFPIDQQVSVAGKDLTLTVRLTRWIDPALRGWFSGDTHIHRELHELRNVVLAEDLNVVFPLTNWVTLSDTPPSAGDKNLKQELPDRLIKVDDHHVIWPRNTEYEIFRVGEKRHTLGALFVLGHRDALQQTVPPWRPVIDSAMAKDPDVLFDMDKLSWPFAMTLPVLAPQSTYELANNHLWRTEFAFRKWYTPTPSYIAPPFGATGGGESEWIDFTLGMYYSLLNCGFRLPPSAGTANGVHPVPAGFGRVYVHLPEGFSYHAWRKGLREGRSFVTTGPMLFAEAADQSAGHEFKYESIADVGDGILVDIEIVSEQPVSFGEILVNGRPEHLLRFRSERTASGAYRAVIKQKVKPTRSGWFAVRFFEDRANGRVRFAHTAPWYVKIGDQPVTPSRQERDYLVDRMKNEIERSRGIVSDAGIREYQQVLDFYQSLPLIDDSQDVARNARPLSEDDRRDWLTNMIHHHRFSEYDVRRATGMSIDEARQAIREQKVKVDHGERASKIVLLPYPGGRHPRRGFLDGAIDPQRETKVSVFPPWVDGGYAVVDVPEAIFSNLGLTYLAHTHIQTIWDETSESLEPLEWTESDGGLSLERVLPNGIAFGSHVRIVEDQAGQAVAMEMWLRNGTRQPLSGLRSQVCVMLKGLIGFNSLRQRPTVVKGPFAAVKSDLGERWIITAWQPNNRVWTNPPVPCLHSDPIFPDCAPGQTVKVSGGLWFYEGDAIESELQRLDASMVWK